MSSKVLGVLTPLGGGDPIPFTKEVVVVGRRPTCDVSLDYENISGKHCEFRLIHGIWNVKDLGSSNGTKVNGQRISSPMSIMPDIEIAIADHLYTIEYEPAGPASIGEHHGVLDDEISETRKRTSLMEMAGLETDDRPVRKRATKPPMKIERIAADEGEFDDNLPDNFPKSLPKKEVQANDDDFFDMIKDDVK